MTGRDADGGFSHGWRRGQRRAAWRRLRPAAGRRADGCAQLARRQRRADVNQSDSKPSRRRRRRPTPAPGPARHQQPRGPRRPGLACRQGRADRGTASARAPLASCAAGDGEPSAAHGLQRYYCQGAKVRDESDDADQMSSRTWRPACRPQRLRNPSTIGTDSPTLAAASVMCSVRSRSRRSSRLNALSTTMATVSERARPQDPGALGTADESGRVEWSHHTLSSLDVRIVPTAPSLAATHEHWRSSTCSTVGFTTKTGKLLMEPRLSGMESRRITKAIRGATPG
jgi:hypothetical protein